MDIFEKCYQRYIQDEVREQGVYPYFHALESRQDTEVIMEGKRRIMLGSNNYLGLTTNSSVIEAGVQAYRTLGSGCSGSRFLNGTLKLHLELEDELAKFLRKDAVVTFSTGFQSNLGIISSIVGLHDYVIMDRENHASLYDGCKLSYGKMLRYQHNDMADLEKKLQKVPDTAGCLIVTDGVFSMDGYIANLKAICDLADRYDALTMVDDSHAVGFMGAHGRGTAEFCGVIGRVDIITGTFGKAMGGASGGYVSGPKEVVDVLRQKARPYLFSNSVAPAIVAASIKVLDLLEGSTEARDRVEANTKYFRGAMTGAGFTIGGKDHPISPVMLGGAALSRRHPADTARETGGASHPFHPGP